MSGNIFKSNSRFSILNEEMDFTSKKKSHSDKRDYNKNFEEYKQVNLFKTHANESGSDISKLIVDKPEKQFITIEDFPELKSDIKKESKQPNLDFKSKLKQVDVEEKHDVEDPLLIDLKPGWTLFKRDPVSRKTIIRENVDNNIVYNEDNTEGSNNATTEQELFYSIVDSLSELHKKRTEEYIELNGYYTWHDMYKFPDYNYNYFDALDEEDDEDDEEDQEYDEDDYDYYYEDEY